MWKRNFELAVLNLNAPITEFETSQTSALYKFLCFCFQTYIIHIIVSIEF